VDVPEFDGSVCASAAEYVLVHAKCEYPLGVSCECCEALLCVDVPEFDCGVIASAAEYVLVHA
jgi:hypothetical protein